MNTILVTGGAGFIGSNFVRYILTTRQDTRVVNLDKLTYAGNLENLEGIVEGRRYSFVHGDICDRATLERIFGESGVTSVVHFAAESHVDRSIMGATEFVRTNVLGTQQLLDSARQGGVTRFVHVSTDEVYGSLGLTGKFSEDTPLHPNSPYAASKASSDFLALAFHHTHGFPVIVTRCSNNYGPYQFPEKLIPLMIVNALEGRPLPVYGDGKQIRDWLYVEDHCAAIDLVLRNGTPGEVYNIGGENEWRNIDVVKFVLRILEKPESLISYVTDRPGHDRRYAIDASKIRSALGWKPSHPFEQRIKDTVSWYLANEQWWRRIISGEYQEYYRRMYDAR